MTMLVQRIEQELAQVQEAVTQTQRLINKLPQTQDDDMQNALIAAIALNMQSYYTGAERIFYEIAKEIDGDVPTGADWHRQVLEQLSVEIPTVRQAVLSQTTLIDLDEFRRFRHVVRSNYAHNLNPDLVVQLSEKLAICSQKLMQDIQVFMRGMGLG
ncbi:ribonuclease toxin HepT-like protein [Coleofasciculus chthonoplastes]|nr:hypothetical protein [Coleofasciculus chthonoplastes]